MECRRLHTLDMKGSGEAARILRGIPGRHREIESGLAGPFEDEHDDDLVAATPR